MKFFFDGTVFHEKNWATENTIEQTFHDLDTGNQNENVIPR